MRLFLRKNVILIILLFLISLNAFNLSYLYCYIMFLLSYKKGEVNALFLLLLLFVLFCALSELIVPIDGIFKTLVIYLCYPLMYLIGRYISCSEKTVINFTSFSKYFNSIALGFELRLLLSYIQSDKRIFYYGARYLTDFWSHNIAPATIVVLWAIPSIIMLFYSISKKNKRWSIIYGVITIINIQISFTLSTRTYIYCLIISAVVVIIRFFGKHLFQINKKINRNDFLKKMIKFIIYSILFILLFKEILNMFINSNLYERLLESNSGGFNGRFEGYLYLIKHFYENVFGGNYFIKYTILQQHNWLLQTYDRFGLIPFILLFYFNIKSLITIYKEYKNDYIILLSVFVFIITFSIEPILTSNFILSSVYILLLGFFSKKKFAKTE